jgi:bacteriocin-like protein
MSKSETRTTDSGTANEPSALTDKELDAVTGGASPKLYQACADGAHLPIGHKEEVELLSWSWGPA